MMNAPVSGLILRGLELTHRLTRGPVPGQRIGPKVTEKMVGRALGNSTTLLETTGMRRFISTWLAFAALGLATGTSYAQAWKEGTNYFAVNPPQPTTVPAGKVEVMEVFSYACPACNAFQPIMKQLKA